MKIRKYLVVTRPDRSGNFGDIPESSIPGVEPIEELGVHEKGLSDADASRIKASGAVVGISRAIPMRLIRPVACGAPKLSKSNAWGIEAIGAAASKWDGDGVVVAVLDTGIDPTHPAFKGVNLETRENFTTDQVGDDEDGHGTHCAATIFGRDFDGIRMGVAPGVKKALIAKVLGREGGCSTDVVRAIQWAVANGADVISMSLGFDPVGYIKQLKEDGFGEDAAFSMAMQDVLETKVLFDAVVRAATASKKDLVFVVAAGNDSFRPDVVLGVTAPAGGPELITVGAVGPGARHALAAFSNSGVDVVAPGIEIESAHLGGGTVSKDGTSMAAPHVAGVAALWCILPAS